MEKVRKACVLDYKCSKGVMFSWEFQPVPKTKFNNTIKEHMQTIKNVLLLHLS